MKIKTINLFFVCAFTAFGFCAPVQGDQPTTQANEKFDIALKLKKNDSFTQAIFMGMEVSSVLPDGKKVSSKVSANYTVDVEVLDVDAEKNACIRSTITNIECAQVADDGKITAFDGTNLTKAVPPQVHDLFVMKGHSIEYIQEEKGKIKDVKGFDELVKKIEGKIVRETLEKSCKQLLEDATILPPRAISLGDSWEVIKDLNGVQVKGIYTLTAVKDDSFEFDTLLQFLPTTDKVQLTGNGTGKLVLDRKSNLVKKAEVEAKVVTTVLTEKAPLNMEFTLTSGLTSTAKTG